MISRVLWQRGPGSFSLLVGAILSLAIVLSAALAPYLTPYGVDEMDMPNRLAPPSLQHPLGTDNFGRDLWTRMVFGARLSLAVGLLSVGLAVLIGTAFGMLAGYLGEPLDSLIMRVVDLFLAFPAIILAMAVVAILSPGLVPVSLALALSMWTQFARLARGLTLSEKTKEYVDSARAIGAGNVRILVRHILPNIWNPLVALATLSLGYAIIAESTLSFLGLGIPPPAPSWGWTMAYGIRYLRDAPHLSIIPGFAISLTVFAFHLLGEGLRLRGQR